MLHSYSSFSFRIITLAILLCALACRKESVKQENLVPQFHSTPGSIGFNKNSVIELRDGNFLYCGADSMGNFFFAKRNLSGDLIWRKDLPWFSSGFFPMLVEDPLGNILVAANAGNFEIQLIKASADGSFLWSDIYQEQGVQMILANIQATPDGNLLLCCEESAATRLIKVNISNGDVLWSRQYAVPAGNQVRDIIEASNGDFMVLGQTATADTGVYLLRIMAGGDLRSFFAIDGAIQTYHSICELDNGNFALCGYAQQTFISDFAMMSITMNGIDQMAKTETFNLGYSTLSEFGFQIRRTADKNLLLVGYGYENIQNTLDVVAIKVTFSGAKIWYRMFGGTQTQEYATNAFVKKDELILAGARWPTVSSSPSTFLVRMKSNGFFY